MAINYNNFRINIDYDAIEAIAAKFWQESTKNEQQNVSFICDDKVSEEAIKLSIELSTKDLMLRTLKAKGQDSKNKLLNDFNSDTDDSLFRCFKTCCDHILYYREKYHLWGSLLKEEFDTWHHDACLCALTTLNQYYMVSEQESVHYGKAQKIVNMTFKYLFCLYNYDYINGKLSNDEHNEYRVLFSRCHMPLDSFIIEWIFRETRKSTDDIHFIKSNCPPWSNLNYEEKNDLTLKDVKDGFKKYIHSYKNIVEIIDYILDNNYFEYYTALEAELFVWQEMQLHLTSEAFIFALTPEKLSNQEKQQIRYLDIESKIKIVEDTLENSKTPAKTNPCEF